MLMYTSGTTGTPKGALLSHGNLMHAGRSVTEAHALTPLDRVLSSLPLYHVNGQCIATVSPLVSGGSIVMPHRFSVSQWWSLVEAYRPTWLNVVPTIIAYLVNGPELTAAQAAACRGVRFARSASAPLPPEHHRAFETRFGISVLEAMGLTECASVAFANPLDPRLRKIGSPGRPLGMDARVVAPDGAARNDGESGEIELRGDNVMQGYHKDPDATARALRDGGWLATGDLGHRDADGFYFITGRLKELIIKGGENIAPREIDEALLKHPAVLEAAAVGIPDRDYGQEILACVVLKADGVCTEADTARALPGRARPVQDTEDVPLRRGAAERSVGQGAEVEARRGGRLKRSRRAAMATAGVQRGSATEFPAGKATTPCSSDISELRWRRRRSRRVHRSVRWCSPRCWPTVCGPYSCCWDGKRSRSSRASRP